MNKTNEKSFPCHGQPKFYGSTSIGERGQIVIPSELRSEFNINPGDKFIFFSMGKVISLVKADDAKDMIDGISNIISLKNDIKKAIE